MTQAHTPAPWYYDPYEESHESAICGGCYQIATVICDDSKRANARLIAAAPELLEACRGILEGIENIALCFGYDGEWDETIKELQSVIAKAEGK